MFVCWGPERTIIYNDAYAEILASKHPGAMGKPFQDVWAEIWDELIPIVESTYAGDSVHMDDIPLLLWRRGYPEPTHFAFSYTPVQNEDGEVAGFFCPCRETTRQVRAEDRTRVQVRLGEALRGVRDGEDVRKAVGTALTDYFHPSRLVRLRVRDGTLRMAPNWPDDIDEPPSGRLESVVLRRAVERRDLVRASGIGEPDEVTHALTTALEASAAMLVPLPASAGPSALALAAPSARMWTDADTAVARELVERGWTELRRMEAAEAKDRSEAQLILVNRELKHRAKNLFSVVHSLVRLSAPPGGSSEDAVVTKIADRIGALAAAHTVGTGEGEPEANLTAIISSLLLPYPQAEERLTIDGPPIGLPDDAVTPLALIIHELATNAIKYGAWSEKAGIVLVQWAGQPCADDSQRLSVTLLWHEHIGRPVKQSGLHRGFGSTLLHTAARQLGGTANQTWHDHGLDTELNLAIARAGGVS